LSIKEIIKNDFYMDDFMTGANSIQESKENVENITIEQEKVVFNLRKWISSPFSLQETEIRERIPKKIVLERFFFCVNRNV